MIFALSKFHAFVISCEVKLQSEEILRNPNMYWILGISLTWEYTPVPSSSYFGLFCLRVSSLRRIFHSSSPEFLSFQRCFVFCSPIFATIFRLPFFSPSQGCQGSDKNSHDSDPLRSTWWNTQDQRHRCWAQKASHIGGRRSYWGTRHWPWRGKVAPSFFRCNGLDPFCNITSLFHRSTSRFLRKGFKDFERVWRKEKDEIEGEQRCTTLQSFYIHAMMKTLHQMQSSEVEKLGATD